MSSISKRFWALLLAASMVFSMMAMSVSATEQAAEPEVPEAGIDIPSAEVPAETEGGVDTPVPEAPAETTEEAVPDETQFLTTGVVGIELQDYSMYPEGGGQWITQDGDTYYRYTWEEKIRWTAIFGDGTRLPVEGLFFGELPLGDSVYVMECRDTQSEAHWQPGGSYEVQVVLKELTQGTECSDTATVVIREESPLLSLTVEPITIYEGQGRETHKEGYTYYDLQNHIRYTAEFSNGELQENVQASGLWYADEWYAFEIIGDQSAENIWGVGEHTLQVSVLGKTVDVPVTILESPVKALTVNPIYLVENQNGGMSSTWVDGQYVEYFSYCWHWDMSYQLTYADGTYEEYTHSSGFHYNDEWYDLSVLDHQESERWTVGNTYTVTVSAFGATTETTVTIVENPVQSIVMDPVTVYKGVDDYEEPVWIENEEDGTYYEVVYDRYQWQSNMGFTVYYKNGEPQHIDSSQLEYMGIITVILLALPPNAAITRFKS